MSANNVSSRCLTTGGCVKRNQHRNHTIFYVFLAMIIYFIPVPAEAQSFLSKVMFFQRGQSPAEKERTMKDLLGAAIDQTVYQASQVNGFYHEPDLKIEIPEQIKKIEEISRKLKGDLFWHQVEMSMNRAAEKAAPKAGVLMKNALEDLHFDKDPEKIIQEEGSLTFYFRRKMEQRLQNDFKREIERSMSGENALASYVEIKHLYESIPFVKNSNKIFGLEDEISRKALAGIFSRIAEQEIRLRSVRAGNN